MRPAAAGAIHPVAAAGLRRNRKPRRRTTILVPADPFEPRPRHCRRTCRGDRHQTSTIEPDILHAPAIIDAVDHDGDVLHLGSPAGAAAHVVDHRSHRVLGQLAIDFPGDLLALLLVRLGRLPGDQRIDLLVAVVHVGARTAGVVLGVILIRIVDAVADLAYRHLVVAGSALAATGPFRL